MRAAKKKIAVGARGKKSAPALETKRLGGRKKKSAPALALLLRARRRT
jgi:hypothetical protein